MSKVKEPGLVEVTLDKAHTHKGKPFQKGATITVTPAQKAWLEARGVIGGKQEDVTNG